MLKAKDIKGYNLFIGLEETELAEIAKLCARKTYETDTVLFSPGDTVPDVFLLEGGNESVQIEIPAAGVKPVVIHTLTKGETFGWAPLCPVEIRTAIARVIEPASVIRINGASLAGLCDRNHHIGYMVMKNLSGIINKRLEYTTLVLRHKLQKMGK